MTVAEYFPSPDSLFVLPEGMKIGFYILASMATLSLCATTSTLAAVAYQRIRGYSTHADQNLLPILQLLVADFIQALGLALSWHWIRTGSILAPTGACTAQGALLNFGDIANGLSVLNIAVDTLYRFRKRQQPGRRVFYSVAAAIFLIPFTMTIIGPIRHGNKFYVRAGNWVSLPLWHPSTSSTARADLSLVLGLTFLPAGTANAPLPLDFYSIIWYRGDIPWTRHQPVTAPLPRPSRNR